MAYKIIFYKIDTLCLRATKDFTPDEQFYDLQVTAIEVFNAADEFSALTLYYRIFHFFN